MDPRLQQLADAFGVAVEYEDWQRRRVEVPESTVRRVLTGLGVDVDHPDQALRRAELDRWRRLVPPTVVAVQGTATTLEVRGPDLGDPVVELTLEDGTVRPLSVSLTHELVPPEESDEEPDTEWAGHSDIVPDDGGVFAGRRQSPD